MNTYEIWVDLLPGVQDLEFVAAVQAYLGFLKAEGKLASFRIRRRKFGLAPDGWREFNVSIDFDDLHQLEEAFERAATRSGELEKLHHAVYSKVTGFKSALYRDFPDPVRHMPLEAT